MTQSNSQLDQFVRGMQVITIGLMMGAFSFLVIAVGIVQFGMDEAPAEGNLISLIMLGFTLMELVPFFLVPSFIRADNPQIRQSLAARSQEGLTEHHAVYRIQTIIRLALIEGACFANTIAYIIEHNWWSLALVGGLLFIMLTLFPTRTQIEHYVESQRVAA
jgi:hypothetical protein